MASNERFNFPSADHGLSCEAREMATATANLFKYHDRGLKTEALKACNNVDSLLFPFLDKSSVHLASSAFIDALWAKDDVELECMRSGDIDSEAIKEADYSRVTKNLRKRASIIGACSEYATEKTKAWRRHKAGGDYWTPYLEAQKHELRAAIQDSDYPNKPRYGRSGPGPEAMRYVLASELHDMRTENYLEQGIEVLIPYYRRILEVHRDDSRY